MAKHELNSKLKHQNKNKAIENSSDKWKYLFVVISIGAAFVISLYYKNYLASLVNKPLNEPKVIDESDYLAEKNLDRYWGSYRPQLYFGMKTRAENPLLNGMIWFSQFDPNFQMR
jgi:mannosyl-oligosaccharide glucosidase